MAKRERQEPGGIEAIFEQQVTNPYSDALVVAAYAALLASGFNIKLEERLTDGRSGDKTISLTAEADLRFNTKAIASLVLALTEAVNHQIDTREPITDLPRFTLEVNRIALDLMIEFMANEDLVKVFVNYYGGLRWKPDEDKFIAGLFEQTTEFDEAFIDEYLDEIMQELPYTLGLPYERYEKFDRKNGRAIVKQNPDLDYRRLRDVDFRHSVEGQRLEKGYKMAAGRITARKFSDAYFSIDSKGNLMAKPLLPLSKVPLIEALIAAEIRFAGPHEAYSLQPSVTEIAIASDSSLIHQSLTNLITTPPLKEVSFMFDGPDDMSFREQLIAELSREYDDVSINQVSRNLIRRDLQTIITAYLPQGSIYQYVAEKRRRESRPGNAHPASLQVGKLRDTMKNLASYFLTCGDPDLARSAASLIRLAMNGTDSLAMEQSQITAALMQSLERVTAPENFTFLKTLADDFFGHGSGETLIRIGRFRQEEFQIYLKPEVMLVKRKMRRSLDKNKSLKEELDILTQGATAISHQEIQIKNWFILDQIQRIIANPGRFDRPEQSVSALLRFFRFNFVGDTVMPDEYNSLVALASSVKNEKIRSSICWHISNNLHLSHQKFFGVKVVIDLYSIALGHPDDLRLPTNENVHAFGSVAHFIHESGGDIFQYATPDQLNLFERYRQVLTSQAEMIAGGKLIGEAGSVSDFVTWRRETMTHISEAGKIMQAVTIAYEKFQHQEGVKNYEYVYYPWIFGKMTDFRNALEIAAKDYHSPAAREVYSIIDRYLKAHRNLFKSGPLTDVFDAVTDAHLDQIVTALYPYLTSHELGYENVFWNEGHTFLYELFAFMPLELFKKIVTRVGKSPMADDMIKKHRAWTE